MTNEQIGYGMKTAEVAKALRTTTWTHQDQERLGKKLLGDLAKKAAADGEERDDHGRWTSGGGGDPGEKPSDYHAMLDKATDGEYAKGMDGVGRLNVMVRGEDAQGRDVNGVHSFEKESPNVGGNWVHRQSESNGYQSDSNRPLTRTTWAGYQRMDPSVGERLDNIAQKADYGRQLAEGTAAAEGEENPEREGEGFHDITNYDGSPPGSGKKDIGMNPDDKRRLGEKLLTQLHAKDAHADQPRDDHGRFAGSGGGGDSAGKSEAPVGADKSLSEKEYHDRLDNAKSAEHTRVPTGWGSVKSLSVNSGAHTDNFSKMAGNWNHVRSDNQMVGPSNGAGIKVPDSVAPRLEALDGRVQSAGGKMSYMPEGATTP